MDVGNPSNFDRMLWLYGGTRTRCAATSAACARPTTTSERRFGEVHRRTGYLLDPHSAIGYLGLTSGSASRSRPGVFLATAHPAKFGEIVEPIIGERVEKPAPLQQAIARPRHIVRIRADIKAVEDVLVQ